VLRAEEVTAVADLLVCAERQRFLGDLQRGELDPQLAQQLDVDDELLVAADQAAFQPAACMTKLVPARKVGSSVISASYADCASAVCDEFRPPPVRNGRP
jgi:hypothetical protein